MRTKPLILFLSGICCGLILLLTSCLPTSGSGEYENQSLQQNFKNPPHKVRPQAWWWWLQTPTNKEAISTFFVFAF